VQIVIIALAKRKLERRGIPVQWVEETIQKPSRTVSGYGGRTVYQRFYQKAGEKEQLLRVVCEESGEKRVVVTAYLTSESHRYWRT